MLWMMERAGKKNSNNSDWQFWQQHNKPLEIKDQGMFDKILKYIHDNPVVAGFVNKAEDWKYSSACDFCGVKGKIKLSFSQRHKRGPLAPTKGDKAGATAKFLFKSAMVGIRVNPVTNLVLTIADLTGITDALFRW